jgi:hypothetical protein
VLKSTGTGKLSMVYLKNGFHCIVNFEMTGEEDDDGEEEAIYTTPFFSQVIC